VLTGSGRRNSDQSQNEYAYDKSFKSHTDSMVPTADTLGW
jgi:hypothetical protein